MGGEKGRKGQNSLPLGKKGGKARSMVIPEAPTTRDLGGKKDVWLRRGTHLGVPPFVLSETKSRGSLQLKETTAFSVKKIYQVSRWQDWRKT